MPVHPLTKLIQEDMVPSLGVTEPGAIALAAAKARTYIDGEIRSICVRMNLPAGFPGPITLAQLMPQLLACSSEILRSD